MVFFVCEGCNESLKKNQVDKHAMKCHGCWAVTCVDCSVTFPGNEYAAHTSCVSEAQKYEGSLYKGKKEKMSAQDKWGVVLEYAEEHMNEAPASIRSYVPTICQSANVPRQQKKFINFAKNSVRLHSPPLLEELWNFLELCKTKCMPPDEPTPATPASEPIKTIDEVVVSTEDVVNEKKVKNKKDKSKKKDKKDKESTPEVEVEAAVVVEEVQEEKKKSKKKKNKEETKTSKTVVEEVVSSTEEKLEKKEKKDKKEKKKKRKLEQESISEGVSKKAK